LWAKKCNLNHIIANVFIMLDTSKKQMYYDYSIYYNIN
jgi:hypothetical protein